MDPLSITASIIAVLQATNAVISVCYNYSSAVKNSSWELPRVTEEVRSLRNVLETLEQLAKKAESADPAAETRLPTLKLLCEPGVRPGPLANCLQELERLKNKLSPPSWAGRDGSKRRALIQALGWPLKEGDTTKTLENIGRFKATLNLAMTADQATLTLAIRDMAQVIQDTTLGVQEDFTKLHKSFMSMMMDSQREKIHQWLSAPDPSSNHNEACKKRQATTGSWFIGSKQFADWKTNSDSLLWLHGIPGCGKTILSSTIIEDVIHHCHLDPALAVTYFYFDFNNIEKQQYEKMICSLITQLSIPYTSTPQALESLFSSCMNGERQPIAGALLTTLQQMVQEFDETFIILNALDECKDRQELLENMEKIAGWKLGKLHILATSRREKDIKKLLDPLVNDQKKICIQSALVNDDIRTYVHNRLQTDWGLKRWQKQSKVQEEIEMTLMNKADGMFRWAVCQLDALRKCLSLPMLQKALASLPETLDDTYTRILCSIYGEYSQDALKILQWLAYSARPLQIEEIVEVIAVNIEGDPRFNPERRLPEPQNILTICSSLITTAAETIEGPHGKTIGIEVRLAHFSVKEYLVSDRVQAGPAARYSIREIYANISIAEICLAYLLQFDKSNFLTSETVNDFPLARYAARYWTQHAQVAVKDTGAIDLLSMELFLSNKDAFVNWIRLFDPDKPWKEPDIAKSSESVASPLYYASQAGLIESTRLLLKRGADVNAQGGGYGSALQAASARGHDQIVQRLLDKGAVQSQ